jgi:ATP-dependent protease HslVU (ClpYQ) peptidase subunit
MSCIVAIASEDGKIVLGGDSAGTNDTAIEIRKDPKVFKREKFLFGFINSFRAGQLLHYSLVVPTRKRGTDMHKFMVTDFATAVYDCLKKGHLLGEDDNDNGINQFMVACTGHIFRIDGDFSVAEVATPWDSIGSGEDFARGALLSQDVIIAQAKRDKRPFVYAPRQRVLDALGIV